jgi:hypothetical protein
MAKIARSTGCVNAPSKLIDPAPTLAAIEQFLARSGTAGQASGVTLFAIPAWCPTCGPVAPLRKTVRLAFWHISR